MKGGRDRDRPVYEDADQIGEDPFRWLCVFESSPQMVMARIEGLQRLDRVQAFMRCETELGPRPKIIKALNDREKELRGRDDQPARADQLTRTAAADGGAQR